MEDEYYSAIEDCDTAIMSRDKKIKEQDGMTGNSVSSCMRKPSS